MGGMLPYVIICENVKKLAHYTKKSWYTFPFRGFELQKFSSQLQNRTSWMKINPFHATDLFWYPLKTSENLWLSDVFTGYQERSVAWNGLRNINIKKKALTIFFAGNLLFLFLILFGYKYCILFIENVVVIGCSVNGSGYWSLSINLRMVAWYMLLGK